MTYGGGNRRAAKPRKVWGGNAKTRPHRRMQESYQVLRAVRSSNYGWTVFVFRIRAIFMI
jgi:hypothetical protein